MDNIDLEALRLAMFAHPGVKAVAPDLRLYRAVEGSMGVAATIHLAAPDVDQTTVQATTEEILRERFGIGEVVLSYEGAGPSPPEAGQGQLEKR